jgi:hypothetical protein
MSTTYTGTLTDGRPFSVTYTIGVAPPVPTPIPTPTPTPVPTPTPSPTPAPLVASPDGTKATAPGTVLVDDALNQWRLVAAAGLGNVVQWRAKGAAAWVAAGYSANVVELQKWGATCYQAAVVGGQREYWSWAGTDWATASGDPSAVPVSPTTGSHFTVTASGFTDPSGKPWTMKGLNAGVQDALDGFGHVFGQFPGLTCIRLNTGGDSAASIDQAVQQYTAKGCVVMIEDHTGNANNIAWYRAMALAYKGNPHVFLEMPNEPLDRGASLAATQTGIINAIRAAGFAGPIGIQPGGGWEFSNVVQAATGQVNVFVTPHIYYDGSDPNGAQNYVAGDISGSIAMGLFPCIDEFGDAEDGYTRNQYGPQVISATIAANLAGKCGACFWAMDNDNHADGADSAFLTRDGSQLTPVGAGPIKGWLA